MSSKGKPKKKEEYIFSVFDQFDKESIYEEYIFSVYHQFEKESEIDDDYIFSAYDHPDFRSSTQYIPDHESKALPILRPKNYLILVSDDENNSFMLPAQNLRDTIRSGAYDFDSITDKVFLVDVHTVEDTRVALRPIRESTHYLYSDIATGGRKVSPQAKNLRE